MREELVFAVMHRGADLVMEEMRQPTPDGHDLSFVGARVGNTIPELAAIAKVRHELGFNALLPSQLGERKSLQYHDKIGFFYELLIPGDTEIRRINESGVSDFVLKSLDDVLEAQRQGRMMELSDMYISREFV